MELKIRKAKKEDTEKFVEVYKSAYMKIKKYSYRKDKMIKWYYRWLLKRDKDGIFVAEVDGKVVGFIACDANWQGFFDENIGEIHELIVKEDCKHKGIGKILIERGEEYLKKKGHKIIELWVGEENPAREFYEKLGYKAKEKFGEWIRMIKFLD